MNNLFSQAAWNTELEDQRHEDIVRQMSEQHIPPQYMPDDTRAWLEAHMAVALQDFSKSSDPAKPERPTGPGILARFRPGQLFEGGLGDNGLTAPPDAPTDLWRGLFTPDSSCPTGEQE